MDDREQTSREVEAPDLETVMHLMWNRLEKLEAQEGWLKRAATIVVAVAIAVFAADLLAHIRSSEQSGPVALRDASGNVRARLDTDPATGATILQLLGSDGRPQAKLAADDSGSGLTFYDKEGDPRLRVGVVSDAPALDLIDKLGAKQTRLDLSSGQTYSHHLADDSDNEPKESAKGWRRTRSALGTESEVSPPPPGKVTCWPGTLGCSRGYSSTREDPSGAG